VEEEVFFGVQLDPTYKPWNSCEAIMGSEWES
jgi:hypothetical protein